MERWPNAPGRPPVSRASLARSFVARAMFELPTTKQLVERLTTDQTLRRLCGGKTNLGNHIIGHISTDSTVIEARERPRENRHSCRGPHKKSRRICWNS